jgi:hypothetical protein
MESGSPGYQDSKHPHCRDCDVFGVRATKDRGAPSWSNNCGVSVERKNSISMVLTVVLAAFQTHSAGCKCVEGPKLLLEMCGSK